MKISGKTQFVGIIGHPVEHSLSPFIHNGAFAALKLDYCYLPLHLLPQDIKAGIDLLRVIRNLKGVNITVPYKEKVIPLLDDVSREAQEIGAVNTVEIREDRGLMGHNTDGRGFLSAFREEIGLGLQGKMILMIGAGGVARAVAHRLTKELAGEIVFINRTPSRAKSLAQQVRAWSPHTKASGFALDDPALPMLLPKVDLLINATSLGLQATDPLPLSLEGLKPDGVVCDLVYSLGGTPFARLARERGFKTMDGFPMLVHQGALAFEIWTGQKAPIQIMQEAIRQA